MRPCRITPTMHRVSVTNGCTPLERISFLRISHCGRATDIKLKTVRSVMLDEPALDSAPVFFVPTSGMARSAVPWRFQPPSRPRRELKGAARSWAVASVQCLLPARAGDFTKANPAPAGKSRPAAQPRSGPATASGPRNHWHAAALSARPGQRPVMVSAPARPSAAARRPEHR